MKIMADLYLGLVHYPIYNKHMKVIATAVTNFDIHDIARTARTYDVKKYFLIHPLKVQEEIIKKMRNITKHIKIFTEKEYCAYFFIQLIVVQQIKKKL